MRDGQDEKYKGFGQRTWQVYIWLLESCACWTVWDCVGCIGFVDEFVFQIIKKDTSNLNSKHHF